MPFMINDGCINCGACEPVCPNGGIRKGKSAYIIDQDACTECVGFFNKQQCVVVCPMDSCILNPSIVLSEEALFERAKALHAHSGKHPTLTAQTSHLRAAAGGTWWERLFGKKEPKADSSLSSSVAES